MLWTEKYRPTKLMHVVGQSNFVLDAEHWVTNQEMPNVLLYGVAGVGKTAAALSLANDMLGDDVKANFFEINASDDRKLETVRTRIKEIASTSKIGEAPFKIILLDEMDGMTRDAQNALKRIMERYADNCRFIITCNDRHKIIHPLISRCANYSFKRLNNDAIRNVIFDVLEKERVTHISEEDLEIFIGSLHGDLRRGLTELQAAVSSKSSLLNMIDKQLMPYTELLELVIQTCQELDIIEVEEINQLQDIIAELYFLPNDLPPVGEGGIPISEHPMFKSLIEKSDSFIRFWPILQVILHPLIRQIGFENWIFDDYDSLE